MKWGVQRGVNELAIALASACEPIRPNRGFGQRNRYLSYRPENRPERPGTYRNGPAVYPAGLQYLPKFPGRPRGVLGSRTGFPGATKYPRGFPGVFRSGVGSVDPVSRVDRVGAIRAIRPVGVDTGIAPLGEPFDFRPDRNRVRDFPEEFRPGHPDDRGPVQTRPGPVGDVFGGGGFDFDFSVHVRSFRGYPPTGFPAGGIRGYSAGNVRDRTTRPSGYTRTNRVFPGPATATITTPFRTVTARVGRRFAAVSATPARFAIPYANAYPIPISRAVSATDFPAANSSRAISDFDFATTIFRAIFVLPRGYRPGPDHRGNRRYPDRIPSRVPGQYPIFVYNRGIYRSGRPVGGPRTARLGSIFRGRYSGPGYRGGSGIPGSGRPVPGGQGRFPVPDRGPVRRSELRQLLTFFFGAGGSTLTLDVQNRFCTCLSGPK